MANLDNAAGGCAHRLRLAKLLRVHSSHDPEALTSLEAYVERMKPDQKQIYFVSGLPHAYTIHMLLVQVGPVLKVLCAPPGHWHTLAMRATAGMIRAEPQRAIFYVSRWS